MKIFLITIYTILWIILTPFILYVVAMQWQNYKDFHDDRLIDLEKKLKTKFPEKHLEETKLVVAEQYWREGYGGINIDKRTKDSQQAKDFAGSWRFIGLKNNRDTSYFLMAGKHLGHYYFLMGLFVENGEGNISHFKLYDTHTDDLDEIIKYYNSIAK